MLSTTRKRKTITREQYHEVVRLLQLGYSRRKVARAAGVSLGSVNSIHSGYIPPSVAGKKPRKKAKVAAAPVARHLGPREVKRGVCPRCDFKVPMPCVYCRAVGYLQAKGGAA